jgi:hypothetical protein
MLGALYFMLPGIVIALVVAYAAVTSYRSKRPYVVASMWLGIMLAALLVNAFAYR